jgi:hypothetical protein
MTFGRALLIALFAGGLARASSGETGVVLACLFWMTWQFTSDPLPAAIRKGLNDFAKEHRR